MLSTMRHGGRANQIARRAGRGQPGGDSGFALFIEILAREALSSLTASEDKQPGTSVADDASAAIKKRSAPPASPGVAQDAEQPTCIQPAHPTSNTARASDARQKRLFD
jgi:hypothetical protein